MVTGNPAQQCTNVSAVGAIKSEIIVKMATPIRFSTIPALAICGILMAPDEKTIALSGVATGNMNA